MHGEERTSAVHKKRYEFSCNGLLILLRYMAWYGSRNGGNGTCSRSARLELGPYHIRCNMQNRFHNKHQQRAGNPLIQNLKMNLTKKISRFRTRGTMLTQKGSAHTRSISSAKLFSSMSLSTPINVCHVAGLLPVPEIHIL